MKTTEDIIREFLSDIRTGIIEQQLQKNIIASGASADSLQITSDKTSGSLTGSHTFYYQVHGRGPGKMPPIKSIEDWIVIKQKEFSPWALAKKIAKEGTYIFKHPEAGLDINSIIEEKKKGLYNILADETVKQIIIKWD